MATTAEATTEFNALLKASESGPVVVTQSGKPVAVLLGVADEDDVERLLMAHSPQLQSILEKSRESIKQGRGIPHAEFWRDRLPPRDAERPNKSKRKSSKKKGSKG